MQFDAKKGDRGYVYDANNVLILGAIRGDTETGIVDSYILDCNGNQQVNHTTGEFLRTVQRHPAPLRIEPLPTNAPSFEQVHERIQRQKRRSHP